MKQIFLTLLGLLACSAAFADTFTIGRLDVCDISKHVYNASHWIEQADLAKGKSMYGESEVPIVELSDALAGLDWIQTACYSRNSMKTELARFELKCDADVLILHNAGISQKPEWMRKYRRTKETLSNAAGDLFQAYSRHYKKGEIVVLGDNGSREHPMYIVAVRPKGKVSRPAVPGSHIADIREFGAVGDGKTLNTNAIQAAIDACAAKPQGGTVLVSGGTFVSGTIELKSNVTLWVEAGSILRGSADHADYPRKKVDLKSYRSGEDFSFLFAHKARNIAISGGGIIDGYSLFDGFPWSGFNNSYERPRLIRMFECENIDVRNITFIRSASWTQYYEACRNLDIEHLTVRCYTGTHNQDGMDLSGCSNVRVYDYLALCGDDAVCLKAMSLVKAENIYVEHVRSHYSNCNIVKIGTETHGDISNVHIKDVEGWARYCLAVEAVDGSNIDGVLYEDALLHGCAAPIFVRLGNRGRTFEGGPNPAPVGSISNVTFRNIRNDEVYWVEAKAGPGVCCAIAGIPGHKIKNVRIEDCDFYMYGTIHDPKVINREVPENEGSYPEFHCLGMLPAHGIYARHVDGLTLSNVRISLKNPDSRPAIVLDDVDNAVVGLRPSH